MCDVYGRLLLGSSCGGSYDYYWSREVNRTDNHYVVSMGRGYAIHYKDTLRSQVVCVH